jgi:hypothetical protein
MRYDLDFVSQMCRECGLSARMDDQRIEVDLGQGAILCFQNAVLDEDCLIGFLGTPWHYHGDCVFADARGYHVELDYLDIIVALKEGRVLVCERQVEGRTVDRWLIHSKYNDEFEYIQEGEQIVVRRAAPAL